MPSAAYLLAELPRLLRELEEARSVVLHGTDREEAFVTARSTPGRHSDSTGKKAVALLRLAAQEAELRRVLEFVYSLSDEEKEVVVTKWRIPWATWTTHVRPWNPAMMLTWLVVVQKLERYLGSRKASAGGAAG
ncbi:MAG TPA: hypothetical protein GXX50_06945 [Firmicutes bacterium]|nr:hypothetical protein [Bacillota bacterium]